MYLKIRTSQTTNGYRVYTAEEVQWHTLSDDTNPVVVSEEVIEERFDDQIAKDQDTTVISFFDHNGKPRHIYTQLEAYLLNSNGKTIERIN